MISVLFIWLFFSLHNICCWILLAFRRPFGRENIQSSTHSLLRAAGKKLNISVILFIYFPNPLTPFQGRQGGGDLSHNALGSSETSTIGTWVSKPVLLYSQRRSFSQNWVSLLFLFRCTFSDFNFIQIKRYLIAIFSNCNLKRKYLIRKLFKLQSKTKNMLKNTITFFFFKILHTKRFYWKLKVFSSSLVVKKRTARYTTPVLIQLSFQFDSFISFRIAEAK